MDLSWADQVLLELVSGKSPWKLPVRVITSSNVALVGYPVVDGIQLGPGDDVLVSEQSDGKQNGIYRLPLSETERWTRRSDFNTDDSIKPMSMVPVSEGNTLAGTIWKLANPPPIQVNVTQLSFVEISQSYAPSGGAYQVPAVVTGDYAAATGQFLRVDPTGGPIEVKLPTASGKAGQTIVVANDSDSEEEITITPDGAELISGVASIVLDTPRGVQAVISDGVGWIAAPGPVPAPEPMFHELVTSPRHVWDIIDATFSGMTLSTWPARVSGATLMPDGSGNGYLEDDDGYPSATFTGGGKLSGDCQLSTAGTTWGYAVRYRAVATHGVTGCVVGWVTSPTPNAQWVVGCVYADNLTNARYGQISLSGGDIGTSGGSTGTGVGADWQVMFIELDATTLYVTIAGVQYTAARPAGTAPFSRINLGYLNYNAASHLYPFTGGISHIVTVDGRMFTAPEKAALTAWTPPA